MLKVCHRRLSRTLFARVKHATQRVLVFQAPQGFYTLYSDEVANVRVKGELKYLQPPQPVDLTVDDNHAITAITVRELPAVFDTLHQVGKEYEKRAVDCFGNVPDVLSVDLNALAKQHEIRSVVEMGTSMHWTITSLGIRNLRLGTLERNRADNWGERILNAEADIVLMPRDKSRYLSHTAIAEGVGQLLSNTNGAMYTLTKKGEVHEVPIRPNSDGVFKDIAAVFQDVRLLVGEVAIPQTQVPFKLLQLQRDLDVLACGALLSESGADKVLATAHDRNTVALLWFNGDRGELANTVRELALLVQHSNLPVTEKRIVVVCCPYISFVGTMATAAQLRSIQKEVSIMMKELRQMILLNTALILLVIALMLPLYYDLVMRLVEARRER